MSYTAGKKETENVATGKNCSNYKANVEAIKQVVLQLQSRKKISLQVVMLTDDPCKQQAANSHQTASGTKQDSSPPVDTSALWQQRG